jgi:tetratricopeptide (TPR) repeat protein
MKKTALCVLLALCLFDIAFSVSDLNASNWLEKGVELVVQGKYNEAIHAFNQAIQFDPTDAVAYNNRGVAYGELGYYEQEIEDCTKAIELNPKLAVAYYHRGIAHQKLGNRKQAEKDKRMAYALNPKRKWDKVEIIATERITPPADEKPLKGMGKKEHTPQNPAQAHAQSVKVVGNRDSKRYHLPGMKYYDKVKEYHRVTFGSEEEAMKAGYHKAPR